MSSQTKTVSGHPGTNFEHLYASQAEPWNYTDSGAEKLRYEFALNLAKRFVPRPDHALDIGCSLGLFTSSLYGYAPHVHAMDLSQIAVEKAEINLREMVRQKTTDGSKPLTTYHFQTGNSVDLPFASNFFDTIFYLDGVVGHELEEDALATSLANIRRILAPGGVVIFTDYLPPRDFARHVERFKRLGMNVKEVHYLNDRLWFQLRANFKVKDSRSVMGKFLANESVARVLAGISSLFGYRGSKHICVVATK